MVLASVGIGWVSAMGGYSFAVSMDASIGGSMGMVATGCFLLALLLAPRYGFLTRAVLRARRRAAAKRPAEARV